MPDRFHIITPLGRPEALPALAAEVAQSGLLRAFEVFWWVMWNGQPTLPAVALPDAQVIHVASPAPGLDAGGRPAYGHAARAHALDLIGDDDPGWVWVLDDDNRIHPRYAARIAGLPRDVGGFVCGQARADGTSLFPSPGMLKPGFCDTAQYTIRRRIIGAERIQPVHADDGAFVGRVWAANKQAFRFTFDILCYHNGLTVPRAALERR